MYYSKSARKLRNTKPGYTLCKPTAKRTAVVRFINESKDGSFFQTLLQGMLPLWSGKGRISRI